MNNPNSIEPCDPAMSRQTPHVIMVRYTGMTYLARIAGLKASASCTMSALDAARAIVRKLNLDVESLQAQLQPVPAPGIEIYTCTAAGPADQ